MESCSPSESVVYDSSPVLRKFSQNFDPRREDGVEEDGEGSDDSDSQEDEIKVDDIKNPFQPKQVELVFQGHTGSVHSICFYPDRNIIISCSEYDIFQWIIEHKIDNLVDSVIIKSKKSIDLGVDFGRVNHMIEYDIDTLLLATEESEILKYSISKAIILEDRIWSETWNEEILKLSLCPSLENASKEQNLGIVLACSDNSIAIFSIEKKMLLYSCDLNGINSSTKLLHSKIYKNSVFLNFGYSEKNSVKLVSFQITDKPISKKEESESEEEEEKIRNMNMNSTCSSSKSSELFNIQKIYPGDGFPIYEIQSYIKHRETVHIQNSTTTTTTTNNNNCDIKDTEIVVFGGEGKRIYFYSVVDEVCMKKIDVQKTVFSMFLTSLSLSTQNFVFLGTFNYICLYKTTRKKSLTSFTDFEEEEEEIIEEKGLSNNNNNKTNKDDLKIFEIKIMNKKKIRKKTISSHSFGINYGILSIQKIQELILKNI